jgi:hypothetical protein
MSAILTRLHIHKCLPVEQLETTEQWLSVPPDVRHKEARDNYYDSLGADRNKLATSCSFQEVSD